MSKQVHRYLVEKFDCGCLHLYEVVKEKKYFSVFDVREVFATVELNNKKVA